MRPPSPKWAGGMAQVVEHLLCKREALNSKPSPAKKKKEKACELK
jgi:hypothetical protein